MEVKNCLLSTISLKPSDTGCIDKESVTFMSNVYTADQVKVAIELYDEQARECNERQQGNLSLEEKHFAAIDAYELDYPFFYDLIVHYFDNKRPSLPGLGEVKKVAVNVGENDLQVVFEVAGQLFHILGELEPDPNSPVVKWDRRSVQEVRNTSGDIDKPVYEPLG
jgi:hypothetical protein